MPQPEKSRNQQEHVATEGLSPRLAEDQFYQALASTQRRRLLYCLVENGENTVGDLASVLSGWEVTATGTMYTQSDRSAIVLQLLHNHLPRLDDADLIAYDADAKTVQLEPLHPRVREIIRQSVEAEQLTPE